MEAKEVQKLAHQLGGQALLITEETHDALAEWENRFHFGRSGKVKLSNLGKTTLIYEVKGRRQPPPSGNLEENLNWTEEQADIG
jgi:hypothetical protein